MYSQITELIHFGWRDLVEGLEKALDNLLSSLQNAVSSQCGQDVHLSILEGRIHYLIHYLFQQYCLVSGSREQSKCIFSARKALNIFSGLLCKIEKPMFWYLYGLGSFSISDCALTLAKWSRENGKLLSDTLMIFSAVHKRSNFFMRYFPQIEEAQLFGP